ncbi:ubiquinone/menaquinone biosynthesis methyltransferase, partial [Rickettsia endosymbiont of Cardiosporidium cionae]|uniref:ubiquinone/menaquinone biosynthesis methyltransferase n=1 Tax=Rickettsia endosymbiont of Cardiosporidium cionae TaxID=2777155 RepID=UPI001895E1B8
MNDGMFYQNSTKKQKFVDKIFTSVTDNYDLMNDLMSFGMHRRWKNIMLNEIDDYSKNLIDIAGGTADIALRYYTKARAQNITPEIIILDINNKMLKSGRDKCINRGMIADKVSWLCANAENIPIADMSMHYYVCAFGIRNMTNLTVVLNEAYRILKPGGKFICLEFSHVSNKLLSKIYNIYSINCIPLLGEVIAHNRQAYEYLIESIKK